MKRYLYSLVGAALLCVFAVHAQETTERHIPVGAYPALQDWQTTSGTLAAVDAAARTVTLRVDSSLRSFRVTDSTDIWLDRSRRGQTTLDADLADLSPGLQADVRVLGRERPDTAKWVKVQLAPED